VLIYLVRHGKAEKKSASGLDQDRVLKERGKRQCVWLGEHLARGEPFAAPALILASRFARAAQTASIVSEITGAPVRFERALELGYPSEDVVELIRRHLGSGRPDPLMLVGHNPQMEILLTALAGPGPGDDGEMRTGMAAIIEIEDAGVREGAGRLVTKLRSDD